MSKNHLEIWIRENFDLQGPGSEQKPPLTFENCCAIWHLLHGRFVKIRFGQPPNTYEEDISGGDVFNSQTLARLMAEKEKTPYLDQNAVVKKLIETDGRFNLLKIPRGDGNWYVRGPNPSKENPQPLIRNPEREAQWGKGPQEIVLFPNPWAPNEEMYNPELDIKVIEAHGKQEKTVVEEAQRILDAQVASGKCKWHTNTFIKCSRPGKDTMNAVGVVFQRTVVTWGENIKDLDGPFPIGAAK